MIIYFIEFMEISDKQLVSNYLKGDEKSLEILIKRYLNPIYSFVYYYINNQEEAEDITQEVFIKVWRNLKKFDRSKSFKTWIFSIAKNTCIDNARKKQKEIPFSKFENKNGKNMVSETIIDKSLLPNNILEKKDIIKLLNSKIKKLSKKYRQVLILKHNEGLTFQEISDILKEPLNTIKSRYRRALLHLKEIIIES